MNEDAAVPFGDPFAQPAARERTGYIGVDAHGSNQAISEPMKGIV